MRSDIPDSNAESIISSDMFLEMSTPAAGFEDYDRQAVCGSRCRRNAARGLCAEVDAAAHTAK